MEKRKSQWGKFRLWEVPFLLRTAPRLYITPPTFICPQPCSFGRWVWLQCSYTQPSAISGFAGAPRKASVFGAISTSATESLRPLFWACSTPAFSFLRIYRRSKSIVWSPMSVPTSHGGITGGNPLVFFCLASIGSTPWSGLPMACCAGILSLPAMKG